MVDRPNPKRKYTDREYVQPQWIVDGANFRILADSSLYAPGQSPPPHLSPFAEVDAEEYVPEYMLTLQQMQVKSHSLLHHNTASEEAFKEDLHLTRAKFSKQHATELKDRLQAEFPLKTIQGEFMDQSLPHALHGQSQTSSKPGLSNCLNSLP